MRKKILVLAVALTIALGIFSCGTDKPSTSVGQDRVSQEDVDTNKSDDKKEENKENTGQTEQSEEEKREETQETAAVEVKVYYCNEDATGFATEDIKIEELTAENLLNELSKKSVVPAAVKALKCEKVKKEGKDVLDLDLSKEIVTYLNQQGTTGEIVTVGGICNTFLEAYDCDGIKITVEDQVLTSGHAEYPGYLSFFEGIR